MAKKSRSVPTSSSRAGNKSKRSSILQCLSFSNINKYVCEVENKTLIPASVLHGLTSMKKFKYRQTVKIMYNDVRVHLSQFIQWVKNLDLDVPNHRKKSGGISKPSFSYDVDDHRNKDDDNRSEPSFNYDVDDHRNKDDDGISRPSFNYDVDDHRNKDGDKVKPNFSYQCYPLSRINKCHCEDGNKIIMPSSALEELMSMTNIEYPMTFKIMNPLLDKFSHCGVLEFSGEEGSVHLPNWMMNSLQLQQGQVVNIEYTALSKGTFLKLQPHSTKFVMNLSDPKETMEGILKDFACVTIGDTIMVNHKNQSYYINIVEARPENAISLFETDCELEFIESLNYKEPEKFKPPEIEQVKEVEDATSLEKDTVFRPFTGVSRRLDDDKKLDVSLRIHARKSVPDLERNCSAAKMKAKMKEIEDVDEKTKDNTEKTKFQPFTGKKYTTSSC